MPDTVVAQLYQDAAHFERRVAIKTTCDPYNLYRVNESILPTGYHAPEQ
jgi:hypothetical protein